MAETSWKSPSNCSNVDRSGKADWTNPSYAEADDTNFANCNVGKTTYGDYLYCQGYGFTTDDVPSGATIDGIYVEKICKAAESTPIDDDVVQLLDETGSLVGSNYKNETNWGTSDTTMYYGGSTDLWGWSDVADTDIRDADFGVAVSAYNEKPIGAVQAYVDWVAVKVYYTTAGVNKDLQIKYDIRSLANDTLQVKYDILNLINKDLQAKWDINILVNKTVQAIWDMAGVVNKTMQFVWDMGGVVHDDIGLQWDILNLISDDLQAVWDIRNLATKDIQAMWDMREISSKDLQAIWDINQIVNDNIQFVWDVAQAAAGAGLISPRMLQRLRLKH